MGAIQFFTTGFGDWRRLLPAGPVRDFYVQIYPHGIRWSALPTPMLHASRAWIESDFARADGDQLTLLVPLLTQRDRTALKRWFDALAAHTLAVVTAELPAFRQLAQQFSNPWNTVEHVLTILILWTINMWVLRRLMAGPVGRHPPHATTGRYFIWGEEVGKGPMSITGIREMRGTTGHALCLMVSRVVSRPGLKDFRRLYTEVGGVSGVDLLGELATHKVSIAALVRKWSLEEATLEEWLADQVRLRVLTPDTPPRVRIPVFGSDAMAEIALVCDGVAERITAWMLEDTMLQPLVDRCSFARCPWSVVLCMLWHNSYYEATDRLIAQGVLPLFPSEAEGDWGVWLTSRLSGRDRPGAPRAR
ncbi:MAG: hypothetical protein HYZ81_13145 [Nitrospinae bacterium]|nr:hypothetical protein [Nitrospinota bacterium]